MKGRLKMSDKSERASLGLEQGNLELFSRSVSDLNSALLRLACPDMKLPENLPQARQDIQQTDALSANGVGQNLAFDLLPGPAPHRSVTMIVQRICNTALSGHGIGASGPLAFISWFTKGAQATHQYPDNFVYYVVPPPGQCWNLEYHTMIYRGAIKGGCGFSSEFEINLTSNIEDPLGTIIGSFQATDSISISGGGTWIFNYPIIANDGAGNSSRIDVRGIVNASCTNVLP